MFEVLNDFIEKNHENHFYKVGDVYPAKGKKMVKSRANELTKVHAEYGVAFLKEVKPAKKADIAATPVEDTEGEA